MNPHVQVTKRTANLVEAYRKGGREIAAALLALADDYSDRAAGATRRLIDRTVTALGLMAARFCKTEIASSHSTASKLAEAAIGKDYKLRDIDRKARMERQMEKSLRFFTEAGDSVRRQTGQIIGAIAAAERALAKTDFKLRATIQETEPIGEFSFPIEEIIGETVAEKEGVNYAKRLIKQRLRDKVEEAEFVEAGGRIFGLAYYAELVARTELMNAFTQGTLDTMEEYGEDLAKYLQHDAPCDVCAGFQGEIFSVSGQDPDYEPLTDENTPPIHPNCECALQPVSKTAMRLGLA